MGWVTYEVGDLWSGCFCNLCLICVSCLCFSVFQFLENFQAIAENNNFFDPGFTPSDMDRIPDLYQRIIDDPALVHSQITKVKCK